MGLLIFDLDGTLIDSRKDLAASVNRALIESGFSPLKEEQIVGHVGNGASSLLADCFEASAGRLASEEELQVLLDEFMHHYKGHCVVHTHPYEGVGNALEQLSSHRHMQMAVLTNKPELPTRIILKHLNLDRYFNFILGGDSGLAKKPSPAGIHELQRRTGVPGAHTVMVGDGSQDMLAAAAANVSFVRAGYGFGDLGEASRIHNLTGATNALTIDTPDQMHTILGLMNTSQGVSS